jgi:hypothetical protein
MISPEKWGEQFETAERAQGALGVFQRAARERGAERINGLVIAAYLSFSRDGRLVQLHLPGIAPERGETRGKVDGFSDESRRRLVTYLHRIRRDAPLPTMVTLTFPAEISVTAKEAKACRRAFAKRMRKAYPAWCALWRLEAHPEMSRRLGRMHPHFHILTWGAWYDLAAVSEAWTACVWNVLELDGEMRGVKEKHRSAGTNCERVRKWAGVAYCAKQYIAKEEDYPLGKSGRVWGWDWRANLPLASVERVGLTLTQAAAVVRQVERWMDSQGIVSESLVRTIYDDDPAAFVAKLMGGGRFRSRRKRLHEKNRKFAAVSNHKTIMGGAPR